ncbi:Fimbrial protein [Citrobacter sedlakii]|uniref:fimbrial protein n=1 Tax=Citrobacter sedlakii TaxID=67826 RepID=UPI001BA7A114|nr:fimbrial protein [Citrobacter sedlakii]EKJ8218678.1 fimbrial protein [Citrobacter sedlakii]QUC30943.1 fimbrial protein [Citrobacter sedlakii]
MNKTLHLILGCALASVSPSLWALTASTQAAVSSNILFIENNIDNEYFITPSSLDPRISGSNTWVKYGDNQVSLGYMGIVGWVSSTSYYRDMWIDDSPVSEPFNGIRCTTGANCPSSGYIAADLTDQYGFYHTKATGAGIAGGYYGFASFTDSAFDYFRSMTVGASETLKLNFCRTTVDYDYAAGARCKDQTSGNWYIRPYTINKIGHLSLESTNAFQELWIASDGTPSITKDSGYCELGVVSSVDGVICKMVSYDLQQTSNLTASLTFRAYIDSAMLGFTPAASAVKYSGNGSNWYNYSATTAYYNVLTTSGDYIYIFLSKTFLKGLVDSGLSITNSQPFTFGFYNSLTPESGYYQFTPSLQLNIVPKEYGISITSTDNTTSAQGSGTIGDADPIEMNYTVTVSGPRQADTITAQVIGDSTTVNGVPYCLFQSAQDGLSVPVPAYLQYNSESGGVIQKRNSCNEAPISMADAQWQQTPWDVNNTDDGSFFTTGLTLLFPMNDSRSMLTVAGADWEGVVSATGEIKVTANWLGVTP